MRIKLPARKISNFGSGQSGGSLPSFTTQDRAPQRVGESSYWGKAKNLFKRIALSEKRAHLQSIRDGWRVKTSALADGKVREFEGARETLGNDPKQFLTKGKGVIDDFEKDFETSLADLNDEEREVVRGSVLDISQQFDRRIYNHVAREKDVYNTNKYNSSIANYANESAHDSFRNVPAGNKIPGTESVSNRPMRSFELYDQGAVERIELRGKDQGWDEETKIVKRRSYYDTAVANRVVNLLNEDRAQLAMAHLQQMKEKISPSVFARLSTQSSGEDRYIMAQGIVDQVRAKNLRGRKAEDYIRKNLKGQSENLALSIYRGEENVEKTRQAHYRSERDRNLVQDAHEVWNKKVAGDTSSPEYKAAERRMRKNVQNAGSSARTEALNVLNGKKSVGDPRFSARLRKAFSDNPESYRDKNFFDYVGKGIDFKTAEDLTQMKEDYLNGKDPGFGRGQYRIIDDVIKAAGTKPNSANGVKMLEELERYGHWHRTSHGKTPSIQDYQKYWESREEDFDVEETGLTKYFQKLVTLGDEELTDLSLSEIGRTLKKLKPSEAIKRIPPENYSIIYKAYKAKGIEPTDKQMVDSFMNYMKVIKGVRRLR